MCLLVVASPHSTPKKKDLEGASCNNPHGFGFAVITPNGIVTGRGMSSTKVIKRFLAVRKEFPQGFAMFHARFATHGVKNEDNCHPFRVPRSGGDTYLAHNGILDIKIQAGDRRSDTRIFAEDTLPAMGGVSALDDQHIWQMVSKWSLGSKIVVFTLDPKAAQQCYIINELSGFWDSAGCWWSNTTYLPETWSSKYLESSPVSAIGEVELMDGACENCDFHISIDANPYYCENCFLCFDCGALMGEECLCYQPSASRHKQNDRESKWYYADEFQ